MSKQMKRLTTLIIILLLLPAMLSAQKVGLVMSGGGARGLAHIGVIKALEENEISIVCNSTSLRYSRRETVELNSSPIISRLFFTDS